MSWNRENIIWQSPDGTWSRGFYPGEASGDPSDPDHDEEWDVEWDYSRFDQVSTGHPSEEAAHASWMGANPGGYDSLPYSDANAEHVAALDHLVLRLRDPAAAAKVDLRVAHGQAVEKFTRLALGAGSRVEVGVARLIAGRIVNDAYDGVLTEADAGALVLPRKARSGSDVVVVTAAGVLAKSVVSVAEAAAPRRRPAYGAYRW